ncbi:uncharacterized protein LOC122671862 isoform X2 [Telopea speciosissima]|uniref:uncharacterized protein LOC122671862 isoform X2 n=1 Tax=Telopea speciosissima TaxID=54955 RepID=UPI001CC5A073|nr:uncharacterized protein LOC122671862 isoform X2 [Telopea speciosissima]
MEEAEKMAALKRAYADIILNTAKEAAARIMVSERKALRFQQELSAAKEEGLNMLLRLKQIMESKIAEAEKASLSQQSRIEELEMQLDEAEEIVRDLRSELKGMQDELESLKSNTGNLLDGQMAIGNATSLAEEAQGDKLNTSNVILCPPPDSECRPMSTCIMKKVPLDQSDDRCCSLSENETAHVEISSDSPVENYCAGNPDLASIIMRSKEPELYRNGCTQRIRAFEGNLLDGGKLPLPGHEDDHCLHIKSGEIVEGTCAVASPNIDNMAVEEKNVAESEEVMQHNSSCDKGQAGKFFHRFSNKRRRTRCRNRKTTSCRPLPDPGEDPSKVTEDEARRDSESHVDSEAGVTKSGSPQNVTSSDPALMDESVLTVLESKAVENVEAPGSKLNPDPVDVPSINSDAKDTKPCETITAAPAQAANDRLLKYTFRRKRKKETVSNPNENALLEKQNTTKRRTLEMQNSAPEPQKSSLIIESSRDSRRLVQVARQLISLSEKRWW